MSFRFLLKKVDFKSFYAYVYLSIFLCRIFLLRRITTALLLNTILTNKKRCEKCRITIFSFCTIQKRIYTFDRGENLLQKISL